MNRRKLEKTSVEEFFQNDEVESSDEESVVDEQEMEVDSDDDANEDIVAKPLSSKKFKTETSQHKLALKQLQKSDPEFYKYLEENDQELLEFEKDSSTDSEAEDGEDNRHVVPSKLEIASDEEEEEIEDEDEDKEGIVQKRPSEETKKHKRVKVTATLLNQWANQLRKEKSVEPIIEVVRVFKAAVDQIGGEGSKDALYQVEGGTAFNGVIRLCILDFVPALNRLLRAPTATEIGALTKFRPTTAKMWNKVHIHVKNYLILMIKVLGCVAEPAIVRVLLKHVLQLVPYYVSFPKTMKAILKKLINFWCTGEEAVRVLSFLCIVRMTKAVPDDLLQFTFKNMYMAYVRNTKFTSASSWPLINFMKHSLVEIFSINPSLAYQHAFVYIRQLSIHLRNAITLKKKDFIKTVYNWQYVHCLYLWSEFLGKMYLNETLQPLVYPLVQTTIGTIKLVPTAKYIPLRFHCVRALTALVKKTGVFIPVLPLITEVLDVVQFNKKHTKVSWSTMHFRCALKLSKSQLSENGFKDAVVDQLYEEVMDYLDTQSFTVGYPELVFPTILRLKEFSKKCKIPAYAKQVKQLCDKLEENRAFIDGRRKGATITLSDSKAVNAWENATRQAGTPFSTYYAKYRPMRDREILHHISKKDQLEVELPDIDRRKKQQDDDRREFADLFGDDDDDDSEEGELNCKLDEL